MISHWERIADEDRCLDPVKNLQPLIKPTPWLKVRYYDTLSVPSKDSAKLALGALDALQGAGLAHHHSVESLCQQRSNSRMQVGVSCGFWVLHYIEEEIRNFNGEGQFSFPYDQQKRLDLLNSFADRLR